MNKHLRQKRINLTIFLGFLFSLFLFQYYIKSNLNKPILVVSKQDEALNINDKILKILGLGQTRLISSIIWIHTLLESDIENYKNDDLNSWMYLRFKSISELEPLFFANYLFGGQYLSIIKDDLLGAKDIYERGLVHYPDNFWLRFHNGFNYYFELNDVEAAIKNYSYIENHPLTAKHAPYLPTLLARMRSQSGNPELAFELLHTIYLNTEKEHPAKLRQHHVLYELKKEIDLSCLNGVTESQSSCEKFDFDKKPYIYRDGKYRAQNDLTN